MKTIIKNVKSEGIVLMTMRSRKKHHLGMQAIINQSAKEATMIVTKIRKVHVENQKPSPNTQMMKMMKRRGK